MRYIFVVCLFCDTNIGTLFYKFLCTLESLTRDGTRTASFSRWRWYKSTIIIMSSNNRDNTLNSCHSMRGTNHRQGKSLHRQTTEITKQYSVLMPLYERNNQKQKCN